MQNQLHTFLDPKAIAVIGASDNVRKVGGRLAKYVASFGYAGNIYYVNPKSETVQGRKAYPNVSSLPEVPEAVVIAVNGEAAVEQVRICAELGVKVAVVGASGFAEAGPEGQDRQRRLVEAARSGGLRLVGPNGQGVGNFQNGAVMNFSSMYLDIPPMDGPIAILGQSGAATSGTYALLRQSGYGVRYVVATGNDADVNVCDMISLCAADPEIRLVLAYLESFSEPEALAEAARLVRERGAFMVVLKSGSSKKGAAAAASHTGALVGNDAALDAFLARHGVWRAEHIGDFLRAVPLYLEKPNAGQGRTIALSHSGAVAVMTADISEKMGLELADLSEGTLSELAQILPDFGTAHNPLDMTGEVLRVPGMFKRVVDAMTSDPQADMLLVSVPVAAPHHDIGAFVDAVDDFRRRSHKPIAVCAPQERIRQMFLTRGFATFAIEADGIAALRQYALHQKLIERSEREPVPAKADSVAGSGLQDEATSLKLMQDAGVPVVPFAECRSEAEVEAVFARLGPKVVVKGCSARLPHKSEHGLVHLGLTSASAASDAARDCFTKLKALGEDKPRVVVAKMAASKGHEFAIGVSVDPVLGPVVMVGEGGTLIELRQDVKSLLAPFTLEAAEEACRSLRIGPLFDGYRGSDSLNLQSLAKAVKQVGDFACNNREAISSIDINPIFVYAGQSEACAVDSVVEFHGEH